MRTYILENLILLILKIYKKGLALRDKGSYDWEHKYKRRVSNKLDLLDTPMSLF